MSEHLTHIAVFDDTVRLVFHAGTFAPAIATSLANHPDAAAMATGARGNHLYAVPFIEQVRDNWTEKKALGSDGQKLAAAIGWLVHRAIDLQTKPMTIKTANIDDVRFSNAENEIYHDAVTFDKVYARGNQKAFSPYIHFSDAVLARDMETHPAAAMVHAGLLEHVFYSLTQQNLMAFHQFHQTAASPEAWLDQFPEHYQKTGENLDTYIEAFTNPDPVKMEKYIHSVNFYNEEDEIIRLARRLQHGQSPETPLNEALKKAKGQSHYAQGLLKSYSFVADANAFFLKKLEKDTFYDRLEIFHKPHRL